MTIQQKSIPYYMQISRVMRLHVERLYSDVSVQAQVWRRARWPASEEREKVLRSSIGHRGGIVMCSVSATDVLDQTGAAGTKQLQDRQRAAQEKARLAKSNTRDPMKKKNEIQLAPASGAQ